MIYSNPLSGMGGTRAAFRRYIGDETVRHIPEEPFGGSTGNEKADSRLCLFLFDAKSAADPIAYFRDVARELMSRSTPGSWHILALRRLAVWLAPDEDGDLTSERDAA
jgi:hypothetical protein